MLKQDFQYWYAATLLRVIDGDTVVIDIDLGLNIALYTQPIRMHGLYSFELSDPRGILARDALVNKLAELDVTPGKPITFRSHYDKRDKYGRLLGRVWVGDVDVTQWMIDAGYGTSTPVRALTPLDVQPTDELPSLWSMLLRKAWDALRRAWVN